MTIFEITIIALFAVIILLLLAIVIQFGVFLQREGVFSVSVKMSSIEEKLENINGEVGKTNARIDGFIPAFKKLLEHNESIENFWAADSSLVIKLLKEIRNCLTQDINWGELTDTVNMMHKNLCVEIADKMVNKMYPVNEGESLDAPFEPDYKLKKDIENKLNGFAAAVLDAECCPQEILDLWTERICKSAHKFIKQFKIDWDKLSKEQQDEFLKRLIMPNYDSPFQPPFNPTCEITNNNDYDSEKDTKR